MDEEDGLRRIQGSGGCDFFSLAFEDLERIQLVFFGLAVNVRPGAFFDLPLADSLGVTGEDGGVTLINSRVPDESAGARRERRHGALIEHEKTERQAAQVNSGQSGKTGPVALGEYLGR